jgi:phosphopantothenoylcysteine decarboxylase/phosphopantothenate--cysteine ligase
MFSGDPEAIETVASRRILVALGGGIACYKVAAVVSTLAQAGAEVHVAMTDAATKFVTPLTFEALSGRAVYHDAWASPQPGDPQHIRLAKSIDVALVAPCTMDLLAKLVHGFTDDPVSLLVSAIDRRQRPVLLAPSMNDVMWHQPATQRNLADATRDGFTVLTPEAGWQACRTVGVGRLPEPDQLVEAIEAAIRDRATSS